VQCLAKKVFEAQINNMFTGLVSDLIDKGLVVMHYVNDIVMCITHDPNKAINLKLLL
jgi:hypothetical protein